MKLLYLSCHAILEYDELKLFEELGIDYFSLGSYIDPQKPVDPIRPGLNKQVDPELLSIAPDRNAIPKEFFDRFDVIVIMHLPEWIEANWENMKHKTVIWRTIGQSTPALERRLWKYRQEGLKIIRYSPMEHNIQDNIGADAVIRFYKDPEEFRFWNGMNREVITFAQNMKNRGQYCNYDAFVTLASRNPEITHVFGPSNEGSAGLNGGFMTYEQMKQKMRDSRVYIYTGTQPASYTLNFIEAMMTGIPIVALGSAYGNSLNLAGNVYEIPEIIANASNGFWSDNLNELSDKIAFLLDHHDTAKAIGEHGRQTAIRLFGKPEIKKLWKVTLDKLITNT